MRTTLTPEKLAELAAQGRAESARSPFVDPCAAAQSKKLLRERRIYSRGEGVSFRDYDARGVAFADYDFF